MATLIDVSFLEFFLPIFISIFVFALIYGVLVKTKVLTDSTNVNAVIAITIAFVVLLTQDVVDLINFMTPWVVIVFLMLFFLSMILMFAGKEQKEVLQYVGGPVFIYIILLLILFIGIGNVFQGVFSPYQQDPEGKTTGSEAIRTIFHPRILGAIIILVISAVAVRQITDQVAKEGK